jgi:hypothetical protein
MPKQGSRPALASRIYHPTGSVPVAGQIEISFMRRLISARGQPYQWVRASTSIRDCGRRLVRSDFVDRK